MESPVIVRGMRNVYGACVHVQVPRGMCLRNIVRHEVAGAVWASTCLSKCSAPFPCAANKETYLWCFAGIICFICGALQEFLLLETLHSLLFKF